MSDTNLIPVAVVEAFHSIDLHIYECIESIGAFEFRFEFARLRNSSGTLTAEVTVYGQSITQPDLPPKRLLGPMVQNLLAGTWQRNVAGALEDQLSGYDWKGILTEIIPTTIEHGAHQYHLAPDAVHDTVRLDDKFAPGASAR